MNRRGFLSTFGALAAAALTVDPEKLLWRPEAKTIFIPKFYEASVPLVDSELYYGWVQIASSSMVRFDVFAYLPLQDLPKESLFHPGTIMRDGPNTYLYTRRREPIAPGSIVAWKENASGEIRVARPGDMPLGVIL